MFKFLYRLRFLVQTLHRRGKDTVYMALLWLYKTKTFKLLIITKKTKKLNNMNKCMRVYLHLCVHGSLYNYMLKDIIKL